MHKDKTTVLFVDDDPFVVTMYRNRLQSAGLGVQTAGDGLAAIDMLPRLHPDVVVLDLMLPRLHGLEVLKFIRGDARLKAVPVVILSNAYMAGLADKALESGANKGMLKAECTPTKLIKLIQSLTSQDAAEDKAEDPETERAEAVSEKDCRESAREELMAQRPAGGGGHTAGMPRVCTRRPVGEPGAPAEPLSPRPFLQRPRPG